MLGSMIKSNVFCLFIVFLKHFYFTLVDGRLREFSFYMPSSFRRSLIKYFRKSYI